MVVHCFATPLSHNRCKSQGMQILAAGGLEGLSITPYPAGRLIGGSIWRISWQGEVSTISMNVVTCECTASCAR